MAPERRRQLLSLAALVAALGIVSYLWWPRPSASASPASNGRGTPADRGSSVARVAPGQQQAPAVHLPELEAERPKPSATRRNLFRFKPPPPPPPTPAPSMAPPPPGPTGPPPPPPTPPIPLKYMGFVITNGERIAALTDQTGHSEHGREGDIIFGRYKILKIGVESVDVAYLDGTGRRTLRVGS